MTTMAARLNIYCEETSAVFPSLPACADAVGFNGSLSELAAKIARGEKVSNLTLRCPELEKTAQKTDRLLKLQGLVDTVFEYETRAGLLPRERFTVKTPDTGGIRLRRALTAPELDSLASRYREYIDYMDDVDAFSPFLYDETENRIGTYLKVSSIGQLYRAAGFPDEPFFYTYNHLRDALTPEGTYTSLTKRPHGLGIATVRRLPELLERPVALMDSDRDDTMVAVLCDVDGKGFPLIAAIRPGGTATYQHRALPATIVCSFYGKPETYFRHKMLEKPERLVYHDMEKGRELDALSKLQLFGGNIAAHDLDKQIIRVPACIVNLQKNAKPSAPSDGRRLSRESKDLSAASRAHAERKGAKPDASRTDGNR